MANEPEDLQKSLRRADSNMQRQFAAVLLDAQKRFASARTGDLAEFMNPPMHTVDDLLTVVNRQNEQFEAFRAHRRKLFQALRVTMDPLELIVGTIAGAGSEVFPPAQGIFAAIAYLIDSARNVSSCYDSIIELFEKLHDFTNRLKFYISQQLSAELHEKVVQILVVLFEILVLATAEVRSGRLKAYFKRLFGKGSPVDESMKRLAQLTESEGRLVDAEALAGVKKSLSNQDRLIEMMTRVDINVQGLRSQTREQALSSNKDRLKNILRPSVYPQDTYDYLDRTRTPGTCEWVLDDPSLEAWIAGQCRFLWISGNMGSGKSYLAARLIRWGLRMLDEQDQENMLGYFFFRNADPETRSVVQALRDVAYQISETDVFYGKQLLNSLSSSDDIKTVSSAFRRLLIDPCKPDKWDRNIYIILDGIDEADPGELREFISLLDTLNSQSTKGTCVQIALIGRNAISEVVLPPLQNNSTSGQQLRTLLVTPERNTHDVTSYIVVGVNEARNLRSLPPAFKNEIVQLMTRQVDGLFILAKFMLSELSQERHMRGILEKLRSYPKEINGMLRQSVIRFSETITEVDARDLNEVLQWVCCAEETLSLEQVETVLALKFGDPPLHLEESLRTHLATFFTLERDDGLSTADLVERHQQLRVAAADGRLSGETLVNPNARNSPDLADSADRDISFNSNKEATWVNFFHASVSEFFQNNCSNNIRASPKHPAIGMDFSAAKVHVLTTCIRIFTDPDYYAFGAQGISLQRYAAKHWQRHLANLDRATLSADTKASIGMSLHTMLTERPVVLAWTNLFEECLDIWSDATIQTVRDWLADPDVLRDLPEARQRWAADAISRPVGVLEPLGRIFANAWLQENFGMYMPTLFCFGVVQTVAFMDRGFKWSDSVDDWDGIPPDARVSRAAKWSQMPKTGHYYRRIGSTLLNFDLHGRALLNFNRALELDGNIVETCGRMGMCLSMGGNYEKALKLHLMANAVEEQALKDNKYKTQRDLANARWRLYKNLYQLAECSRKLGRVEQAVAYCRDAIKNSYDAPTFEPETALMRILAENNRVAEIMGLLIELDERFTDEGHSRLVFFLLHQIPSDATQDWIPDAAARTNRSTMIARRYQAAIDIAQEAQNSRADFYLRNALGRVYMSAEEYDRAIVIQETICFQDYKSRGSIEVRKEYASSFRNLARLYYFKALESDPTLRGPAVDDWVQKLEGLQEQQGKYQNRNVPLHVAGFDVNEASIFLVLFYRFRGRQKEARELATQLVVQSLDILEDDEPQNDEIGVRNLQRILIANGDEPHALAVCQSTRTAIRPANPSSKHLLADRRVSSPRLGISPKRHARELNLTNIFTEDGEFSPDLACDYCLRRFGVDETYAQCMYCIDTLFCLHCLENVIKLRSFSPGHSSACGPNHHWLSIPPLEQELNEGEIMHGGKVMRISDWKKLLRKAYNVAERSPRGISPITSPRASPNLGLGLL